MINGTDSSETFYLLNRTEKKIPIIFIHGVGLTHEFTIHDAPFDDEVIIAIGGSSSGRAHARTGARYQDMKEMGIEPK